MSVHPRRAVIVVDVQNEYFTGNLQIEYPPSSQSLSHITRIMDAATAAGVPVVVIQHDSPHDSPAFAVGSDGWQLHPEIAQRHRDALFRKLLPSSFSGTDLGEWLEQHQIDTVTVVGYMTHNCDDTTVKHAFDRGLDVEFVPDASGAVSYANRAGYASAEEIHRVYSVVQQSRFAAVLSTEEWLGVLASGEKPVRDNILDSYRRAQVRQSAAA
jgi:nicotinamidase-related amidase